MLDLRDAVADDDVGVGDLFVIAGGAGQVNLVAVGRKRRLRDLEKRRRPAPDPGRKRRRIPGTEQRALAGQRCWR